MSLVSRYEAGLWWTIEALGISESIRDKILVAVGIQFVVSIGQAAIPLFFTGPLRVDLAAVLFVFAIVAFANTVLIVRRDLLEPIAGLEAAATDIANGEIQTTTPTTRHDDEIAELVSAFAAMVDNLQLVADQATALASQEFDDPVLDEQVPGRFGQLLSTMTAELTEYIDRIEADRDRFQLLNYLVGHDIPNILTVLYGRIDLIKTTSEDPAVLEEVETIERHVEEIEAVSTSVSQLTSDKLLLQMDVVDIVAEVVADVQHSHPEATISVQTPDSSMYVRANELLSRAFVNLVTNAIEHNDARDPEVEVSVFSNTQDDVTVQIEDNGPGLGVEESDAFLDSLSPGTGLHISMTIIERFGGDFAVSSDDSGTTVTATMPRSRP
ncbi:ATP-binding protein [Halanaeroarchaeum sp. HSR-CO]|uniref:HAMP domain-containing sensor histidine kinase n=1 Tax=Halanaeroarchaeum sp. HSR-CO TaxID=2866382 RepID=UPI00217E9A6D|nr:ATP-binding protein [Halanaeroarchaeum sp. HSR-CO]